MEKKGVKIVIKYSRNASREVQKQKFSYPGEGDTPSSGPHPPAVSALQASAAETRASLTAENINFLEGGGE